MRAWARWWDATLKMGGIAIITADHGNAEQMTEPDGSPMTAHTTNPVPFILCGAGTELRSGGRLADIAPHHPGRDGPGLPAGDGRKDPDREVIPPRQRDRLQAVSFSV